MTPCQQRSAAAVQLEAVQPTVRAAAQLDGFRANAQRAQTVSTAAILALTCTVAAQRLKV
jgi:hypothetical protein